MTIRARMGSKGSNKHNKKGKGNKKWKNKMKKSDVKNDEEGVSLIQISSQSDSHDFATNNLIRWNFACDESCQFRFSGRNGSSSSAEIYLKKKESVWVQGPSGVGKTSICRKIYEASKSDSEEVEHNEVLGFSAWSTPGSKVLFLLQEAPLVDSLSVFENLQLAHEQTSRNSNGRIKQIISNSLSQFGLDASSVGVKMPTELSLGMRRRVALAQMLVQRPDVLILDEPFASLDPATAREVAETIKQVQENTGLIVVLISHNPSVAKVLCEEGNSKRLVLSTIGTGGQSSMPSSWVTRLPGYQKFHKKFPRQTFVWRFVSTLFRYFCLSAPLLLASGLLIGAGVMVTITKIVDNIDVDLILKAIPDDIRNNAMFKLFKGTIDKYAGESLAKGKMKILGTGMTYLFTIEIAPLITGLLMAGRIGGIVSGELSTLKATEQAELLKSLGVPLLKWTVPPALCTVIILGPIFSGIFAYGLLWAGSLVASYSKSLNDSYDNPGDLLWADVKDTAFHHNLNGCRDYSCGVGTWVPFIHIYRSVAYHAFLVLSAQASSYIYNSDSPRKVAQSIGRSVVAAQAIVLFLDVLFNYVLSLCINMDGW